MNDETWKRVVAERPENAEADPIAAALVELVEARRLGLPHVVAQLGLSLDGRIATDTGDSRYINGSDALTHLHRLRALVDGVLVGAGTARIDNPRLNVRLCEGQSPARIVIDPNGTVGPEAKVWADDGTECIVFGGTDRLPSHVERIKTGEGEIAIGQIVEALADRGLTRLLVEGGADTLARFLAAKQIDELHLLYGRVIIGCGPVGINLPSIPKLSAAPRPGGSTTVFPDGDLLVCCKFGDQAPI
ncbi:MAG: RibD family protein [Pseudomonadota bacterium]